MIDPKKSQEKLKALFKNGYVSKTLKTIQIGMKSTFEWIGEDILTTENPATYQSPYTA